MKHMKLVLIATLLMLAQCGSGTESGRIFSPESGHPSQWAHPFAIGTGSFHGTAIREVPQGSGGAGLFLLHCAPCHGERATGKIGPDIRGVALAGIDAAIAGVPIMRGHSILSSRERSDIAGYLASLAAGASAVSGQIRTDACIQCHGSDLDGGIAQISCFSCHRGSSGEIGHPPGWGSGTNDPVHSHAPYARAFREACTTCHGVDLKGYFAPGCQSCHNGTVAPVLPDFLLR